jgi:hypothetical protein
METAQQLDPSSSESQVGRGTLDHRRIGLLAMCAVLALIAGYAGGAAGREASWLAVANDLAIPVVGVIVAAALLRAIDLAALRRRISTDAAYSQSISAETRARLEERYPGVSVRARQIDPAVFVERALGKGRGASAPGRPGSKAGA